MSLPLGDRAHVAAGATNQSKLVRKRILNLAAGCMGGGQFRPLICSDQLSQRDLRLIAQVEYLIKHRNEGRNALPPNWPNLVEYTISAEDLNRRFSFYEVYQNDLFTEQPEFIIKAKDEPQREFYLENLDKQISILLEYPMFLRFLYKFSLVENDLELADKDAELEKISGYSRIHESLYMAELLQIIREVLSAQYFCTQCLQTFSKPSLIIPHCTSKHKSFISEENLEILRNGRDQRRRDEEEDRRRETHTRNHSDCNVCFRQPDEI